MKILTVDFETDGTPWPNNIQLIGVCVAQPSSDPIWFEGEEAIREVVKHSMSALTTFEYPHLRVIKEKQDEQD